jgi:hypothetical protein
MYHQLQLQRLSRIKMAINKNDARVLVCSFCQKTVEPGSILNASDVPHCPDCGAELDTWINIPTAKEKAALSGRVVSRREVSRPPWMSEKEENGLLEISYLSQVANSEATFWYVVGAFLLGYYLFQVRDPMGNGPWTLGLAVAFLYAFVLIDHFFARIRIQATPERLTVISSIFHPGQASGWKANEIRQLYSHQCEKRYRGHRSSSYSSWKETPTYEIILISAEGTVFTLLSNLKEMDAALYVEQRLEGFLGIPDEEVPLEIPH